MRRTTMLAAALAAFLATPLIAGPKPAAPAGKMSAETVRLSTKAHGGGYANPNLAFFFVLAYISAAVLAN